VRRAVESLGPLLDFAIDEQGVTQWQ